MTTTTMRSVEWAAPERLRMVEREVPEPREGEALLEVDFCGICGSDLHSYFEGLAAVPGQILGHEFSGTVLAAPGVAGLAPGDVVTARPLIHCGRCPACRRGESQLCSDQTNVGYAEPGAFADKVLIPRAEVGDTVFHLPAAEEPRVGALVEPLAVSLHAINRAEPRPEDQVVVIGGGMIGLGVTRLLALRGVARIVVSDVSALRRERASFAGADRVVDPASEKLSRVAAEFDLVFDCAGVEAALKEGIRCLRRGGIAVLVAAYGGPVPVSVNRVFGRELELRGSIGYRDEFPEVIALLAGDDIDPDLFVTHTFGLAEFERAFRTQADPATSMKVMLSPKLG